MSPGCLSRRQSARIGRGRASLAAQEEFNNLYFLVAQFGPCLLFGPWHRPVSSGRLHRALGLLQLDSTRCESGADVGSDDVADGLLRASDGAEIGDISSIIGGFDLTPVECPVLNLGRLRNCWTRFAGRPSRL